MIKNNIKETLSSEARAEDVAIRATNRVAQSLLYDEDPFEVIILDPFGSAVPHLDAAFSNVPHGGRIELCATDVNVLYGSRPSIARRHYSSATILSDRRPPGYRERGIRLLLAAVAQAAGRHDKGIRPLYSVSKEHYCLVSVQVMRRGDNGIVNRTAQQVQPVQICSNCNYAQVATTSPTPSPCCGSTKDFELSQGPLWVGPLFDVDVIESMVRIARDTNFRTPDGQELAVISKDTQAILEMIQQESILEDALFTRRPAIAAPEWTPKLDYVQDELERRGFRSSRTHFDPQALRCNASPSEFDACVQEAVRKNR